MRTFLPCLLSASISIALIGCGSGADVAVTVTGSRGLEASVAQMSPAPAQPQLMLHVVRIEAHVAGTGAADDDDDAMTGDGTPGTVEERDDDSGWIVLDDGAHDVDLLTIEASSQEIASAKVPEGKVTQIRLVLDSDSNATFISNGARQEIDVPSGSQSGLKLVIAPPVRITAAERSVFKIELDGAVDLKTARGTLRPTAKVTVSVVASPPPSNM